MSGGKVSQIHEIKINLFGNFQILKGEKPLRLSYYQIECLLIYLLLEHPKPLNREFIAEILWPERMEGTGKNYLRRAIHLLKKNLENNGINFIQAEKNQIRIEKKSALWVDIFEWNEIYDKIIQGKKSQDKDFTRAFSLFATGLLSGYVREPSTEYRFRILHEQSHYFNKLAELSMRAVDHCLAKRNYRILPDIFRKILELEPYDTTPYEYALERLLENGEKKTAKQLHRFILKAFGSNPDQDFINEMNEISKRYFHGLINPVKIHAVLPADLTSFIGREKEISKILSIISQPDCRLVTIAGHGGFGKTRLAIECARRMDDGSFEDGIYFLNCTGITGEEEIFRRIAALFNIEQVKYPEMTAQNLIRENHILLILDEFENLLHLAGSVTKLLNFGLFIKIIITSRIRLALPAEHIFQLESMEIISPGNKQKADAPLLFMESARRISGHKHWNKEDLSLISEICSLAGGVPLAIEIIATWSFNQSLSAIKERLKSIGFEKLGREILNLGNIFQTQLKMLTESELEKFYFIGNFTYSFEKEAAREAFDIPETAFHKYCNLALLNLQENGFYRMHTLLRQFCLEKLESMGGKFQAREMLAEYMGKRADREYQFLFSAGKDPIAVFWLYEKEMEESWMFAFQNDRPDIAYQLSKPFSIYLEYKGVYNKAIHYYNDVGLSFCNSKSPAKSDNYYYNLIIRLYNLAGIFYLRKGDGEKASQLFNSVESKIMERKNFPKQMPLDPWQKEKEWDELALYWSRGQQCILRNDSIKGEDYFIKSYELAKKSGMILPLTVILVGLGELFLATDANKALEFLIRAKNTEAGKNIPWIRSTIYPMIGMANMISGNIREARIYFLESLKYLKTFPFPRIKAQCFSFLAQLSFTSKEKKNLGAYYANHAIFICESIGDYLSAARFCLTAAQYSGEGSQPFNKNYYLEKAMEIANLGNLDELRPEIEKNLKI